MKSISRFSIAVGSLVVLLSTGCVSEGQLKEKMEKIIKENPKMLTDAIKASPVEFMEALQEAAKSAREDMAKKREGDEKKRFDESFQKPLEPVIRADESIRGTKGAPLILVEYSDFQCPFCTRGFETVRKLLDTYKGKIQFVYKHLPLSFHDKAMISAQYYEAIRLQDEKKAFDFHDELFANQAKLSKGQPFLDSIAKKLGVDMKKLSADINSSAVTERIKQDQEEAAKFGMQGTPGFLLNGIPVRGAYPPEHFEEIVNKLKELGKVNI